MTTMNNEDPADPSVRHPRELPEPAAKLRRRNRRNKEKQMNESSPPVEVALSAQLGAWQPIETAPRDGYMLVHEDGAIRALLRIDGVWHKCGYPALIDTTWGDVLVGEDAKRMLPPGYRLEVRDGCCDNPTHWMPLPPAPSA